MKHAAFLAALLLIAGSAFALSLEVQKNSYSKGETIAISGKCRAGTVELGATTGNKVVFHETTNCQEAGQYAMEYPIAQLDPKGRWAITAVAGAENRSTDIYVNPTRESGYLLITLLSPSETVHYRTEDFNASIRILDNGVPVADAKVVAWGADGSRHELANAGNGIYSMQYFMPMDAPLGKWDFLVTAQKGEGGPAIGGEGAFALTVSPSPIDVQVKSPEATNFSAGFEIPVRVYLTYLDKRPFSGDVVLKIKGEEFGMAQGDDYIYRYVFVPREKHLGTTEISIEGTDKYGNRAQKTITLVINEGIINRDTMLVATGVAAVIAAVVIFSRIKGVLGRGMAKRGVSKRKEEIEREISHLKKEYFEKAAIGKKSYAKRIAELESELRKIAEETF